MDRGAYPKSKRIGKKYSGSIVLCLHYNTQGETNGDGLHHCIATVSSMTPSDSLQCSPALIASSFPSTLNTFVDSTSSILLGTSMDPPVVYHVCVVGAYMDHSVASAGTPNGTNASDIGIMAREHDDLAQ